MSEKKQPQRLVIKGLIDAGNATRETIKAELGIPASTLATNLSYLRMGGFYAISDADGILSFTDEEGWDTIQAEKKANKKVSKVSVKTPYEQFLAAEKRVVTTLAAEVKARANADAAGNENELLNARLDKADAESRIAKLTLASIMDTYSDEITEAQEAAKAETEALVEEVIDTDEGGDDDLL